MPDCLFCRILAGELPGTFVWRDADCAAFMDIQPVNPGHVLVVPVRHATHLADIDADAAARLMAVAHRIAAAVRASGVRCEGVNLFLADGEAAMQEVPHVHLHVFPRFPGDGFGLRFGPHYRDRPPRAELEQVADALRAALDR
jgi:histidine triad (HIT) family protein